MPERLGEFTDVRELVATEIQMEILVGVGGSLAILHNSFWLALLMAIIAFARSVRKNEDDG